MGLNLSSASVTLGKLLHLFIHKMESILYALVGWFYKLNNIMQLKCLGQYMLRKWQLGYYGFPTSKFLESWTVY